MIFGMPRALISSLGRKICSYSPWHMRTLGNGDLSWHTSRMNGTKSLMWKRKSLILGHGLGFIGLACDICYLSQGALINHPFLVAARLNRFWQYQFNAMWLASTHEARWSGPNFRQCRGVFHEVWIWLGCHMCWSIITLKWYKWGHDIFGYVVHKQQYGNNIIRGKRYVQ